MDSWKEFPENNKVVIEVPVELLRKSYGRYKNIPCKVIFDSSVQECVVAGDFSKLHSLLAGKSGNVNLLDYIPQLIPRWGKQISLITYQNGFYSPSKRWKKAGSPGNPEFYHLLAQSPQEKSQEKKAIKKFHKMGELIQSNFPEKTLCIGLFCPSGSHEKSPIELHYLLGAIRKQINSFLPPPVWLHVAFRESATFITTAVEEFIREDRTRFKRHLISLNYGPSIPVSPFITKFALNTYAEGDISRLQLRTPDSGEDCLIEFVPSLNPSKDKSSPSLLEDHDFDGVTYQAALKENIERVKKMIKSSVKIE